MFKTLAVTLERCSGCAIFIDDKIEFASSEERYTRIKSDEFYPINSIEDGLEFCKLKGDDFDRILIAGKRLTLIPLLVRTYSNFSVKDHLKAMEEYWYPKLVKGENKNFAKIFEAKINTSQYPFNTTFAKDLDYFSFEHPVSEENGIKISNFFKKTLSSHLKIDESKIEQIDHHTCHAAYGFYGSPIRDDNTLILTLDAWGDDLSGSISLYDKSSKKINRVKHFFHKDFQLGRIYRYATLLLRMLPSDHEYKVMGLAPYYNGPAIREVEKVLNDMQSLNDLTFIFNKNIPDIFEHLKENLKQFRFDHIAAGIQAFTEKMLVKLVKNAMSEYRSKSLVFSGGLSMNVKANLAISKLPEIERFFVCGGGGDETLSIGACYHYAELNHIDSKPLTDLYLGTKSEYQNHELQYFKQFKITNFDNIEQVLEKILDGKIIATYLGRTEMGPRALGNRSILADPRNLNNVQIINRMIKNRDFWMPFAPIILAEFQDELIINPKKIESPYMTIAFDTKDGKEKIPAAIHQYDHTARPQILKKNSNPMLWELIKKFYDKTGIPAILNTSFNLHGEPLVNSIKDAAHVFKNSGLEVLWLEHHIVEKD